MGFVIARRMLLVVLCVPLFIAAIVVVQFLDFNRKPMDAVMMALDGYPDFLDMPGFFLKHASYSIEAADSAYVLQYMLSRYGSDENLDADIAELLPVIIEKGANVNDGVLHQAVHNNQPDLVKVMLNSEADMQKASVSQDERCADTPAWEYALCLNNIYPGQYDEVVALLASERGVVAEVKQADTRSTELHTAVHYNDMERVKRLLANGADTQQVFKSQNDFCPDTPVLEYALCLNKVHHGDYYELIVLLSDHEENAEALQ